MLFLCIQQSEGISRISTILPEIKEEVCVHEGDRVLKREVVVAIKELPSGILELPSLAIL